MVYKHLNTSYVTVKQVQELGFLGQDLYLNTSYVTVKPDCAVTAEILKPEFKYIICYC